MKPILRLLTEPLSIEDAKALSPVTFIMVGSQNEVNGYSGFIKLTYFKGTDSFYNTQCYEHRSDICAQVYVLELVSNSVAFIVKD